ncbi:MAG: methyltransferase domain-containing protein [Pseudomonadota bacterium]
MTNDIDKNLAVEWDKRWDGSQEKERLTILGRKMFNAKEHILKKVLDDIQIRTVVEVGCGLGHTLRIFHDAGYECEGIDISPEAVAVCRKKRLNATLMNLDAMDRQFDLVSSDGMLEHFLNFEPYAEHLVRISRRYVLLIQPNHGSFIGKTLAYLSELLVGDKNVYEYNYRIMDFINIFAGHGFNIVRNEKIFLDVFRLLLFEKVGLRNSCE